MTQHIASGGSRTSNPLILYLTLTLSLCPLVLNVYAFKMIQCSMPLPLNAHFPQTMYMKQLSNSTI